MKIIRNFDPFEDFNVDTDFLKNGTLFQKAFSRTLFESSKIENATFPYKTSLWEANVKENRKGSTKWNYHKEESFVSNYFIFLKSLFMFKNLL